MSEKLEAVAGFEIVVVYGARAVEGETTIALHNWCSLSPGSISFVNCIIRDA
jgi:hypothetical protein